MANESLQKNVISGKVFKIESREGVTKKGAPYIGGNIFVETSEDNVIPVSFFATETKKDGSPNPVFASLKTVVNEYKSIATAGREDADSVEVGMARLAENTFFVQDGRMIRGWQFSSPFFNRKAGVEGKGEFCVVGEIVSVGDEVVNDVPTGKMIVRLMLITYGDTANILDFVVEAEAAVHYVKANFTPGMEVKLTGDIVVVETIEEKITPAAFGDPIVEEIRKTERKLVVKSSTAPVDSPLSEAERTTILSARESRISQDKEAFLAKQKAPSKGGAANFSL